MLSARRSRSNPSAGGKAMPGFISQEGGNAGASPFDTSQAPATPFQGIDWFGATKTIGTLLQRATTNAVSQGYILGDDAPDATPLPAVPTLSAQEANDKYGGDGLKFSNPVPESVAQSMQQDHQEAALRADISARQPPGFVASVERGVTQFAAGLLDPTNIAASFVPGFGEEQIAGAAARAFGEGLAGRTVARAAVGAEAGALGQIPLTAAQAELSHQDQQDFGMADAARQVLMGAAFGGALHPVAGALGELAGQKDPISQAFANTALGKIVGADPETRQTAATAAVAGVADGREDLGVTPLIELSAREREQALALRSMQYDATQPLAMRLNALEDDLTRPGVPGAVLPNLDEQYKALQDIQASQEDILKANQFPDTDEATQARLDDIDNELTQPGALSANRAAYLYQQRRMLTEGAAPTDQAEVELQQARTRSIIQGNQIAIDRNNQRIADLQDQIRNSRAAQEALTGSTPALREASAQMEKTVQAAPKVLVAPEPTPEMETDWDEVVNQMRDRGELTEEDEATLAQMKEEDADGEAHAKAQEAFGACMAGTL